MILFLLIGSQNESTLTQNGVKKYKKVSKIEIMNQNILKKQQKDSKNQIMTLFYVEIG